MRWHIGHRPLAQLLFVCDFAPPRHCNQYLRLPIAIFDGTSKYIDTFLAQADQIEVSKCIIFFRMIVSHLVTFQLTRRTLFE